MKREYFLDRNKYSGKGRPKKSDYSWYMVNAFGYRVKPLLFDMTKFWNKKIINKKDLKIS